MKLEEHILTSITAAERNELDLALLHVCIAIDRTAQKFYDAGHSGRSNYINFLRIYYWVIEPMTGGGINFEDTKWNNLQLEDNSGKPIKNADLAAIIYHAFRCQQVHGKEVEENFRIMPRGSDGTLSYHISKGRLNIPMTLIWGLVAACVFSKVNADVETDTNHYLTLGGNKFHLGDWWGLEDSARPIMKKHNKVRVTLQGLEGIQPIPSTEL